MVRGCHVFLASNLPGLSYGVRRREACRHFICGPFCYTTGEQLIATPEGDAMRVVPRYQCDDLGWAFPPGCLDSDISALSDDETEEDDQRETDEWNLPDTLEDPPETCGSDGEEQKVGGQGSGLV